MLYHSLNVTYSMLTEPSSQGVRLTLDSMKTNDLLEANEIA